MHSFVIASKVLLRLQKVVPLKKVTLQRTLSLVCQLENVSLMLRYCNDTALASEHARARTHAHAHTHTHTIMRLRMRPGTQGLMKLSYQSIGLNSTNNFCLRPLSL